MTHTSPLRTLFSHTDHLVPVSGVPIGDLQRPLVIAHSYCNFIMR